MKYMELNLNNPQKIILVTEVSMLANKLIINHIIDDGRRVKAEITFTDGTNEQIQTWLLWSDESYDAIGQWTDQDVLSRLTVLIDL